MTYWTKIWRWTSSPSTLPLRMDKWLLSLPAGWKISFGVWIRYTVDSPGAPPSMALNGEGTQYKHPPIDETQGDIRLLKLHPGNPGDTISTSLVTSHLSNGPFFEAISYVWGNYSDRAQILVDGQLYCISKSLHDALHDLRHPDSVRTFWADQVCIDQSAESMAERSDQVGKMGQIYKTASNVVVYLGRGTEHTETDMQHLQSFIQPYARGEEAPWSHIPIPDLGRSINNILTSPWFERMWTVQEAVLAKKTTLQCGNYQVQWTCDLRTLRALVFRIKSAVISPVYHLHGTAKVDWTPLLYILESQMRQAARKEGVVLQRNLLDVAFDYRYRKCVQPRDRYFAVLGIIEDDRGGSMCFEPDYSISVEEVHRQFTAEIQRISEIEDAPLEEFRAVDPSSLPKCLGVDPSPFPRLGEPWIGSFTPICTSALNDTG